MPRSLPLVWQILKNVFIFLIKHLICIIFYNNAIQSCLKIVAYNNALALNILSNSFSIAGQLPRKPSTTFFDHLKYSSHRLEDQPLGVPLHKSRRLYSLSASFTSLASWLDVGAWTICNLFLSSLGRLLSSVTSRTISVTVFPNFFSSSSNVVSVSSTVSWRSAACRTIRSLMPASFVKILATPVIQSILRTVSKYYNKRTIKRQLKMLLYLWDDWCTE